MQRNKVSGMPVCEGYVGQTMAKILRDSGCSGIVICKSIVNNDQMTEESQLCVLIDGTVRRVPVAKIYVNTPYYVGDVEALCMDKPVYDLIIGNIPGVRDPGDPNTDWDSNTDLDQNKRREVSARRQMTNANAVETRAQKKKEEGKYQRLKVLEAIDVDVDGMKEAQRKDLSLKSLREKAENGKNKIKKNGAISSVEWRNDLLYRVFQSQEIENGKVFRQLIVPAGYRETVLKLAHESVMGGH